MSRESPRAECVGRRSSLKLRYVAALLALALVSPFVAFHAWDRVEAWRVGTRIDRIARSGQPVAIDAASGETPATAEQKRASRVYGEAVRRSLSAHGARFMDAGSLITRLAELPAGEAPGAEQLGRLQALETEYTVALQLLDEATSLDAQGFAPADRPKFDMDARNLANVNAVRIARLALAGDQDGSARALLATLRLGRMSSAYWRRYTLPTSHSLHLVLEAGAPPPAVLAALQREYERIEQDLDVGQALLYDRARLLSFMQPGDLGEGLAAVSALSGRRPAAFEALAYRLLRPMRRHSMVTALDGYGAALDVARQPWPAKLDATEDLSRRRPANRSSRRRSFVQQGVAPWGSNVGTQALISLVPATAENLARAHASTTALAIARYATDHAGDLPAALDLLVPKYLRTVRQDPFSGASMRYVRRGSAYAVYSIGANRRDDGGRWYVASDLLPGRGAPEDVGLASGEWPHHGRR